MKGRGTGTEQILGRREPWRAAARRELQGDAARAGACSLQRRLAWQCGDRTGQDRDGQGARGRNPIDVNKVQAQVCVRVGGRECRNPGGGKFQGMGC